MGAADFRAGRRCLMHSAKPLGLILPRGSPRFLDMSLAARCPQSPRTTPPLHALVASGRATGFAISGRLAVVDSVTRPNRVRLRCGSPLCSPRLRPDGLLRWPLGPLYVERAINIVELSSTRHARLRPGAPETQSAEKMVTGTSRGPFRGRTDPIEPEQSRSDPCGEPSVASSKRAADHSVPGRLVYV
jgi:hypothetical protein